MNAVYPMKFRLIPLFIILSLLASCLAEPVFEVNDVDAPPTEQPPDTTNNNGLSDSSSIMELLNGFTAPAAIVSEDGRDVYIADLARYDLGYERNIFSVPQFEEVVEVKFNHSGTKLMLVWIEGVFDGYVEIYDLASESIVQVYPLDDVWRSRFFWMPDDESIYVLHKTGVFLTDTTLGAATQFDPYELLDSPIYGKALEASAAASDDNRTVKLMMRYLNAPQGKYWCNQIDLYMNSGAYVHHDINQTQTCNVTHMAYSNEDTYFFWQEGANNLRYYSTSGYPENGTHLPRFVDHPNIIDVGFHEASGLFIATAYDTTDNDLAIYLDDDIFNGNVITQATNAFDIKFTQFDFY